MPGFATPHGRNRQLADHPARPIHAIQNWLSDPAQLIHWQGQLVDSCNEISHQLAQINHRLKADDDVVLRVIGSHASA